MFGRKPGRPPARPTPPVGEEAESDSKGPRGGPASFSGRGLPRGPALGRGRPRAGAIGPSPRPSMDADPASPSALESGASTDSEILVVEAEPYEAASDEGEGSFDEVLPPDGQEDEESMLESIHLDPYTDDSADPGVETTRSQTWSEHSVRVAELVDALYSGCDAFFPHVRTVGDLMEPVDTAYRVEQSLHDALVDRQDSNRSPILVVEQQQRRSSDPPAPRHFVGFLGPDLLRRLMPSGLGMPTELPLDEELGRQSLGAYAELRPAPPPVLPQTSLLEAVDRLCEVGATALPVVELSGSGRPTLVGILSRERVISTFLKMETLRRLRKVKSRGPRLMDVMDGRGRGVPTEVLLDSVVVQVSDIMREKAPSVRAEASLSEAIVAIQSSLLPCLPVVEQGALVGMVSATDIAAALPPPRVEFLQGLPAQEKSYLEHLFLLDPADGDLAQTLTHRVASVMQENPIAETAEGRWLEAAAVLYSDDSPGRALPVVGETEDVLLGFITEVEVLRVILAVGGMT